MPYTVAHVAAVIPGYKLLSRAHVFSAAVIGSMVPDFGFLLPHDPARWETHSLRGLITFCLPAGLLSYWVTQLLIKPAALEVLPDGAYCRLQAAHPDAAPSSARTWLAVSAVLLLGAVSHLVWDGFTHEGARGVRALSFLNEYGPDLDGHRVQLYRLLQLGSSVAGLVLVVVAVIVWLLHARAPASPISRRLNERERLAWLCLYLLPPVAMVAWALWRASVTGVSALSNSHGLGSVAIASIRGAVISLCFVSLLLRMRLAGA